MLEDRPTPREILERWKAGREEHQREELRALLIITLFLAAVAGGLVAIFLGSMP